MQLKISEINKESTEVGWVILMKYIYVKWKYLGNILWNILNVSMINIYNHFPI